jgi:hypothetical protein
MDLVPCNCGYGPGFYHTSKTGSHEYNPSVPAAKACARLEADRAPRAKFFGHIDGHYALAIVKGSSRTFHYNRLGFAGAFAAAAQFVRDNNSQLDLFN